MIKARQKGWWITCGECGHKLFKVVGSGADAPSPVIEIKCHSCKGLNEWRYNERRKDGDNDE